MYKNTPATVKHRIEYADNPTPAVVISVEAAHVDNPVLLDYLTTAVMLEETEIGNKDRNIPNGTNCLDDEPNPGMAVGCAGYKAQGDESFEHHAILTGSSQGRVLTELERFHL